MTVVIGGSYQGKLDFVRRELVDSDEGVYTCCADEPHADLSMRVIDKFHLLILAQIRAGISTMQYLEENYEYLRGKLIIADDISCGVVPIDSEMRRWREETGRALNYLTFRADSAYRIFCGLGAKMK